MKKDGITLISLVITVIVLLILAGITISIVLGENGLIKRAEMAKNNYLEAEQNEKADMDYMESEFDTYLEPFEEIKNYKMLYDGMAEIEGEKEAIDITGGWVDITSNCTSSYGTGSKKVSKNQNSINFYCNGNGSIPAVAIKNNMSDIDYYKIYTKFNGKASTTTYTDFSICLYYLNVDPINHKFSIYGSNDNRIDRNEVGIYYKGYSYSNKILSTKKPINKQGYICIYLNTYAQGMTSYNFSADLQECWIVKKDDYSKLANLAGIQQNYIEVEEMLTRQCLLKICSKPRAVEYMINQCTGDFMCELLASDEAIYSLTPEVKKKMKKNENWNKFIYIYDKQELFEE